jgi:RimJ/RimL family protein N-acetyltransferase
VLKGVLPTIATPEAEKTYRVVYAVHELLDAAQTRFIGLVTLRSLDANSFALPAHLFPPSTLTVPRSVLTVELGYLFLPIAWSRGFATESVDAVLSACGVAPSYWEPFKQVYVRAVVAAENPASLKVVAKCGMRKLGVHTWKGEKAWLAGQWRDELDFHIWGIWVPE